MSGSSEEEFEDVGFPYPKSPGLAAKFIVDFFETIKRNLEIARAWLQLKALFQIHVESPEVLLWIDTSSGKDMRVYLGKPRAKPDVAITLRAETFHELYSGELGISEAFSSNAIRTEGDGNLVLEMIKTLPQSTKMYINYCKQLQLAP